ncbi:hypothetical protein C8R42DRAFT_743462 [Lentinula raphanica]|nr:hypothetical protein C8R42DRAFT_743462 [Lentinula raphanica]
MVRAVETIEAVELGGRSMMQTSQRFNVATFNAAVAGEGRETKGTKEYSEGSGDIPERERVGAEEDLRRYPTRVGRMKGEGREKTGFQVHFVRSILTRGLREARQEKRFNMNTKRVTVYFNLFMDIAFEARDTKLQKRLILPQLELGQEEHMVFERDHGNGRDLVPNLASYGRCGRGGGRWKTRVAAEVADIEIDFEERSVEDNYRNPRKASFTPIWHKPHDTLFLMRFPSCFLSILLVANVDRKNGVRIL